MYKLSIFVSVRRAHLPNSSFKGDGVRVFLSGRDRPYGQDLHAPTKLLSDTLQAQVVQECPQPGATVSSVATSHGINANVIRKSMPLYRDQPAATVVSGRYRPKQSLANSSAVDPKRPPRSAAIAEKQSPAANIGSSKHTLPLIKIVACPR